MARYEALRAWRKERAARRNVDPDIILSNAVLLSLARRRPGTLQELEKVEALGPVKREKYGQEILHVLQKG